MEKFERALIWVRTITAGILVVSFGSIEEAVSEATKSHGIWPYMLTFVVASVAFRLIEKAVEISIEGSASLRKFIVGKHFIEGYWKGVIRDDLNKIVSAGIMFVYYEEGRLKVSVQNFDDRGILKGVFRAASAEYFDGELHFMFQGEQDSGSASGAVSIVFGISQSLPSSFRGDFYESISKNHYKIHGERVVDADELEQCSRLEDNAALVAQAYLQAFIGSGVYK